MRQAYEAASRRCAFSPAPWIVLVLTAAGAGCQHIVLQENYDRPNRHAVVSDSPSRQGREWEMNQQWQNRPLSDLEAAMGAPKLIMNIPGGGNPPGFVAVYGRDPKSGCIDAFALVAGPDPMIRIYHCR